MLIEGAAVEEGCEVLTAVADAVEFVDDHETETRLLAVLGVACEAARKKWDAEGRMLSGRQLVAYGNASTRLTELPRVPQLEASWDYGDRRLRDVLDQEHYERLQKDELVEWMEFITAVRTTEPRFLIKKAFPRAYAKEIEALMKQMEEELQLADGDEEDVLRSEAERLDALAAVAEGLAGFQGEHVEVAIELQNRLRSTAGDLRERATEIEEPEEESDDEGARATGFDIAALFSDL